MFARENPVTVRHARGKAASNKAHQSGDLPGYYLNIHAGAWDLKRSIKDAY